ncbi:MAG: lysozyme [Desulfovibrio sp.]|uniref:lysozyme n=1 Tax=Desulfovibrio sp. TaxID=885 RepID=UPI00258B0983|nr:lysozyme [Desulfovibrio sp.]MCD7983732.1 lysozyme [Desulfovibrio sp.]
MLIAILLNLIHCTTSPYLEAVKHYEGLYLAPYRCPAGVWTYGYGHTRGVTADTPPLTKAEAHLLLLCDMTEAGADVLRLAGDALQDTDDLTAATNRFVALTSWTFNLGAANLASSTMLKRIREKRWEDAAEEMLRWNKATVDGTKRVLPGLTKRRRSEAHFFLTGEVILF